MSSNFDFTVASWFLGYVLVKPISTHSAPQPPKPSSDSPVILTLSIIKALGENSRQIPVTNYTAY